MWQWLVAHLSEKGETYIVASVALLVCGALAGSVGQQWLDTRIDGRIQVKLTSIAGDVSELKDGLKAVQEVTLASQIVELQRQLCLSPGSAHVIRQLEELQHRYSQINGARYPETRCELLVPRT